MENTSCCSGNKSGCCSSQGESKKIVIDFLFLDLDVCGRCRGADHNLEEALKEVSGVLEAAGYDVSVNKVNIEAKETAIKYRFLSSPTIRVNGKDIALDVKESVCKDCGDLCGEEVDCRVWHYQGVDYNEPPKPMIINAILQEIYGENTTVESNEDDYRLPVNLETFFNGKTHKNINDTNRKKG